MNRITSAINHGRYFVYMVECSDGTYYTGSTLNLEKRLKLHNSGNGAKCLRGKRPVKLIYTKWYRSQANALKAEREIKSLSRNQKTEMIKTAGVTAKSLRT